MIDRARLVLLPGLLCDTTLWAGTAAALDDVADCTNADLTRDDSIAAMAERVLATAPARFALASLSMGGYVAFEILRRAPERVTRLALLDTSAAPDTPDKAAQRRGAIASSKLGRFLGVTERMLPQLVHPRHVAGPIGAAVREMAGRVGGEAFARQQQAILTRPDSRPMLVGIAVPTSIAVGDADVLTPLAEARAMHAAIAGSTLEVIADCGHLPPLERPAFTEALLRDWLRR